MNDLQQRDTVGLIDRRDLLLREWPSYLSVREHREAATYYHPERRSRTITSRLLTKYLVSQPKAAEYLRVTADELAAASHAGWADIESLSGIAQDRRPAVIRVTGKSNLAWSASSSHCGPYTAACVSRKRVGLDLERIEPRRQEFYTHMFSAEERQWVMDARSRASVPEAAFTLLWSVKEAYLKASGNQDLSVWAFSRWTVWFDGQMDAVLQPEVLETFVRVGGGIRTAAFSQSLDMAVMRVEDMILATVQCGTEQAGGRLRDN